MPFVYVLKIENEFGTYLELIRRILEPKSKSKPHITVRYSNKPNNEIPFYDKKRI